MLGALAATTCATQAEDTPDEFEATKLVYVHDGLGRLRAVADPERDMAVYSYDAVGNLLGVDRHRSRELAVVEVVPQRANAGDEVVVWGSGFGADVDDNTVRFGEAEAEITAASPFSLTVVAPDRAGSGPVEVETSGGSAVSSVDVEVVEDRMPVVDGFSPATVAPGGEVRIQGRNFTGDPLLDMVVIGGSTYATVTSTSDTELVVTVPPTAPTGRLTVATPYGRVRSDETLVVAPLGYAADEVRGRHGVEVDETATFSVDAGRVELVRFDGERGQRLGLAFGEDGLGCAELAIGLADPSGVTLVDPHVPDLGIALDDSRPWCARDGTENDRGVLLPASGRYTLTVAPQRSDPGRIQLTLRNLDEPEQSSEPESSESSDVGTGLREPEALLAGSGDVLDGVAWLPVDLASGAPVFEETDMVVSDDLLPLSLTRSHWPVPAGPSFAPTSDPGEFGLGAALEFDMELKPSSALQFVELVLPNGISVVFDRTSEGTDRDTATFTHTTTSTGFFGASITWTGVSWDMRLPEGAVLEFAPDGPLRALRDRQGNATTIQRDGAVDALGQRSDGKVVSVHSPTGRWLAFSYDAAGRVVEARNHLGDSVTYRYDEVGRLINVVSTTHGGDGANEVSYEYDERGLVSSVIRAGQSMTVGYDAAGRVANQRLADGSQFSFTYVTEVRPTEIEDVTVDAVVRAEVTDPRGRLRRVEFASGQWVTDSYAVGTPAQQGFTAERDPETGFVTAQVDPDGGRTGYSYDELGSVVSVTGAEGAEDEALTTFDYATGAFDLTEIAAPAGRREMSYDGAGNLRRETSYSGAETSFGYDSRGRLTSVTDASGEATTVAYELGHRVTVTDPQGGAVAEFYDAAGRLAARTGPTGSTTTYEYDGFDRVRAVVDPAGGETLFEYDPAGNLAAVTDAGGNRTGYTYDVLGRVTSRTDPAGVTEQLAYDAAGNLVARTDRRGVRSSFVYDELGRLSVAAYGLDETGALESADSTISYRYDPAGQLTELNDSAYGTITLAYDDLDRLIAETTPQGEVIYSYDAAGRRTSMALADGPETEYRYDDSGRVASITQGDAKVAFVRDQMGRVVDLDLPNDVAASHSYDERGALRGLDYAVDGRALGNYRYRYDEAAQRSAVAGELATATLPDEVGGAEYGPGNTLVESDGEELVYDAGGNLTSDGTNTYTWDARGQLVAVDGAVVASFAYDPFGRRTGKTVDGVTTTYTYDGQNVLRTDTAGSTAMYLYGPGLDEIYARTVDDEVTTYLTDGQGSVTGLVGSDGEVGTRYRYDPFGNTTVDGEDDPNPFTYTGRELDETGLHYYRARYYSAKHGRFISQDPIGFAGGDPNLYAYAANDPATFTDPTGLQAATIAGLIICAAAASWYFSVLDRVLEDWEQIAIFNPDAPIAAGSDEAQILIDRGIRDILTAGEIMLTICMVAMGLPGLGGMIGRGATSFGRGLTSLAARGGTRFAGRFPNAAARVSARFPNLSTRLGLNVGRIPPPTGARFVANSEGVITNLVPDSPNAISLGRFPAYVDDAAASGARAFNVGDDWAAMAARTDRFGGTGEGSEIWIRNTRFLDDAVARQSDIRLASDPLDPLNEGSFFLREVEYLRSIGAL